jgi:hypothetical protein
MTAIGTFDRARGSKTRLEFVVPRVIDVFALTATALCLAGVPKTSTFFFGLGQSHQEPARYKMLEGCTG